MAFTRILAELQTHATARMLFAVAASMAMLGGSALAKKGIIGKDDRTLVPAKYEYLARGVGILVDHVVRSHCTAFCVTRNLIVTNAHCLVDRTSRRSTGKTDTRNYTFYLLKFGARRHYVALAVNKIGESGDTRLSILSGRSAQAQRFLSKRDWFRSLHDDWAVAKLWYPACIDSELKIADEELLLQSEKLKKMRMFSIGYPGDKWDKKDRLPRYAPCRITKITRRQGHNTARHTCDGYAGSSGSPIFAETKQGPRVVAIYAGSSRHYKYRRRRNGNRYKALAWTTNLAVLPLEFLPMLPRFESARFLNGDYSIEQLQTALKAAGHHRGAVDGQFGPQTQASIKRFERALGLVPLGIPTVEIVDKLRALP